MDFCSAITFRLGNSIHKVCTIVHTGRQMICSVERLDLGIGAHSNHYDCDHHHHQHDHLESGDCQTEVEGGGGGTRPISISFTFRMILFSILMDYQHP